MKIKLRSCRKCKRPTLQTNIDINILDAKIKVWYCSICGAYFNPVTDLEDMEIPNTFDNDGSEKGKMGF